MSFTTKVALTANLKVDQQFSFKTKHLSSFCFQVSWMLCSVVCDAKAFSCQQPVNLTSSPTSFICLLILYIYTLYDIHVDFLTLSSTTPTHFVRGILARLVD
jgi:hypothetical protein